MRHQQEWVGSSLTLAIMITVMIISYRILRKTKGETLDSQEMRKKMGNLYLNLKTVQNEKLYFYLAFFLQRSALVLAVVLIE
jgi:hypothetical protein